jgi:hypothetical protein
LVPRARLELARLSTTDFESIKSTISSPGQKHILKEEGHTVNEISEVQGLLLR